MDPLKRTLYVSDADGTLLLPDATLSRFTRDTVNRLVEQGVLFTVASARSVVTIREVCEGLRLRLPVIELNGGFLSDFETGEHLVTNSIEPGLLPDLYALATEHGTAPITLTFDGERDRVYYDRAHNEGMATYIRNRTRARDPRMTQTDDLEVAFRDVVACVTLIGEADEMRELKDALRERFDGRLASHLFEDTYDRGWHWLTVHDRRASKDKAIHALMEFADLGEHEIVVFGDNDNDIPMFEVADRAIAVANATDALKSLATEVIGSNDKDSVAEWLLRDLGLD